MEAYNHRISPTLSTPVAIRKALTGIIRERKSIYADEFTGQPIQEETLWEILTNASWAPNHKMTEPWRFIAYLEDSLRDFGLYMAEYYREYYKSKLPGKDFLIKYEYLKAYPLKASCMIGLILVHNAKIALPEWEEIAAMSCAVQNMALTCTAHDLGGYWCTTEAAIDYVKSSGLAENERSLGLFFIGHPCKEILNIAPVKKRSPIEKKVTVFR